MTELRDEPTTLREMLEFVADWAHECAEGDEPDNFYGFAEIEGQCRLALAATPEPAIESGGPCGIVGCGVRDYHDELDHDWSASDGSIGGNVRRLW